MFVDTSHGALFYEVIEPDPSLKNEPETILFLHGVAINHEIWSNWVPELSKAYRLVLIGTRGYGLSASMSNVTSWTIDDVSQDILMVANDLGVNRFHLVGESFGGTAVLNLALRDPDRVISVTMVSAAHRGGQIERVREWQADVEQNGIEGWSEQMMAHRFKQGAISDEQYAWFHAQQSKTSAAPLLHMGELLLKADLTAQLPDLECPLLIISPDQSPFVTPDIAAEIMLLVPSGNLCIIPNSRHGIVFSHGGFCAQQLLKFLHQLPSYPPNEMEIVAQD